MGVDHMDISSDYGQPLTSTVTGHQLFPTFVGNDHDGSRSDVLCLSPITKAISTFDENVLPPSTTKHRQLAANLGDLSLDSQSSLHTRWI